MGKRIFESRVGKLERNVYDTLKGEIRLTLLERDINEFCPGFSGGVLSVLDIGGGSGRFARICAEHGNRVLLCDVSSEMVELAKASMASQPPAGGVSVVQADFLSPWQPAEEQFDLVLMHGSAEWMEMPGEAIRKAIGLLRPGGVFSLLVFNRDRNMLKRGINGLLLSGESAPVRNKLTPPGAMSPADVKVLLQTFEGALLLQSGIRVFHRFFRQIDEGLLAPGQWLEQEKLYYRQEPFSGLGEHTHFLWQAEE